MAENSAGDFFGDSSLFDEFGGGPRSSSEESDEGEDEVINDRGKYEEEISQLRRENLQLKQKLRLLIRNSDVTIENPGSDGPVAQVIVMNNDVAKKYHQDLEDFMVKLSSQDQYNLQETDSERMKPPPQNSAVVLEKDQKTTESPLVKMQQAFTAISNVQYYSGFCIDQLGRPLIDHNPQLTGWETPLYQQVFMESLPLEDDGSKPKKKTKMKPLCFNCGKEDHSLRDCPMPRDHAKINQNRQQFKSHFGASPRSNRYHVDEEELAKRFPNVKPGIISDALKEALGIGPHQLPPFIYQMRLHGYPPGHMKEAEIETSGITMYNNKGRATTDTGDELEYGEISEEDRRPMYDQCKIIEYPGFNVPLPPGYVDEFARLNMPPMQLHQSKEVMQLYFSPASNEARKRPRSDEERGTHRPWKRQKLAARIEQDMEVDNDTSDGSAGLLFKPPLPPEMSAGTPPPPLPSDTPPSTPGRQTPTHVVESDSEKVFTINSASNSGQNSRCTTPELEELEQKQQMLLAALEDAGDSTMGMDLAATTDDSQGTGDEAESTTEEERASVQEEVSTATSEDEQGVSKTDRTCENLTNRTELTETSEQMSNGKSNNQITPAACSTDASGIPEEGVNGNREVSSSASCTPSKMLDLTHKKSLKGIPDAKNFASGISPYRPHENVKPTSGVYLKLRGIMKKIQKDK